MSMIARPLVCLLALMLLGSAPRALAHPQDGAHADVRITIDDTGVRFEVALNLVFLDSVCPTTRENAAAVHPVEEAHVRDALFSYFRERHPVVIDGVEVTPTLESFAVVRPEPELLPLFPRTGARGLLRVRIDLRYSAKSPPKTVSMTWAGFPPDEINAEPGQSPQPLVVEAQLTAEGQFSIIRFTHTEPVVSWTASGLRPEDRFLSVPDLPPLKPGVVRVPALSALCLLGLVGWIAVAGARKQIRRQGLALMVGGSILLVGALLARDVGSISWNRRLAEGPRLPSEIEAIAIFSPLHANIYRAFDYDNESAIYDALARSVDGDLLDELYNQIFQSLIMQEEGGAVSRVQEVRLVDASLESARADPAAGSVSFDVDARWQVDGVVYHYGHSHWRTNEYRARYTVEQSKSGWRIGATTVLEQFRVAAGQIGEDTSQRAPAPVPGEL
ncbi:MAG: hypothetical protein H6811_04305 [Phycisphaeraceae bacterium]|nr:hypothetical protein [Phycisphaeraceae bacterium]